MRLQFPLYARGKVRDVYDLGERLLLVATDRISAFDHVLPTVIGDKGKILTAISSFWFRQVCSFCPTHFLSEDWSEIGKLGFDAEEFAGRSMLVRRAERVDVECVVRGYLAGSGWKSYVQEGHICGISLPPGLRESERLVEPLFTPTTKEEGGRHDRPIDFEELEARVGQASAEHLRRMSLALYRFAHGLCLEKGLILADTKFEFGWLGRELALIDEAFTPDSSRYWDASEYSPGRPQNVFDKQVVRDYLEGLGWDKKPPAPPLPPEVVEQIRKRYREVLRRMVEG
ncbi:MAG: phosphoribosylaminoimidazolesuccinocarboxamide synthase [Elusimicrobia bacterium]|nr:phosphoribosylaminoimidazolesuccinocarboxamide synthase [Elusimicrobiota bacterium]